MTPAIFLDFASANFAALAALVLSYGVLLDRAGPGRRVNPLAIGLVFGLGAAFQVFASPDIMPGIRGDLRHVTIAVAAAWGGPVAGGAALLMALLARASVGSWDAAPLALASASIALAMGLVARRFEVLESRRGRLTWCVLSAFLPVSAARWIGHLTSSTVVAPVTGWLVLSLVPIATLMATMLVALLRRLDAHAAAERALHDAQNAQRLALGAAGSGFWRWAEGATELFTDAHLSRQLGLPQGPSRCALHPEDLDGVAIALGAGLEAEVRVRAGDANWRWLRLTGRADGDSGEAAVHPSWTPGAERAGVAVDITEMRSARERLGVMLQRDALTEMPHRTTFLTQAKELHDALAPGQVLSVVVVDIADFAALNIAHGEQAGDEILRAVGRRITHVAETHGCIAGRVGADSFALGEVRSYEENPGSDGASTELARWALADATGSVALAGLEVALSGYAGVARVRRADGLDTRDVLVAAENAAIVARTRGHGAIAEEGEHTRREVGERLAMERRLSLAVESNELSLAWQAQFASSGDLVGVEALLRWQTPDGPISPVHFIPIAERTGAILPIGEWVLAEACANLKRWEEVGLPASFERIGINVSLVQVERGDLAVRFPAICQAHGVSPRRFELEVTESLMMRDPEGVGRTIGALRDAGFALAIDDFGTGFSSLSMLRKLPFERLKIDRAFTCRIVHDASDRALVGAMIDLARNLDMSVIAEGVESLEELRSLEALGCRAHQGYLGSRPLPAAAFEPLLRAGRVTMSPPG